MPFPKKFKHLIELQNEDVEKPDYTWLTYAVCAVNQNSCGWGGWMIESVFKKTQKKYPTGTGDKSLSAVDEQVCPKCGGGTYRTGASLKFDISQDQKRSSTEGVDYDFIPPKYE